MPGMLGGGMMFTCHQCKAIKERSGKLWWIQYATWTDLVEHRAKHHASDFVNGVPFWMLEDRLFEHEYYWIARQTHDKAWLKWANSRR
jgi:hypothetical protein